MSKLFTSKEKTTTNATNRPWFPQYVDDAMEKAVELGMDYADMEYSPYEGTRFADFAPDEIEAFDLTRSLIGAYQPDMSFSSEALREVTRQGLNGIDQRLIDAYANPFTTMVMDQRRNRAFEDFERAKSDLAAQKANIGAFGGSRLGLQESNLFDEFQQRLSEEEGKMLMNRFDRAISGAQEGLLRGQQGAVDTANLASMRQGMGLQDVSSLSNIGSQQRALEQAGLDFDYEQWLRSQMDPLTRAQGLMGITQPVAALNRGEDSWSQAKKTSTPSPMEMIGQTASVLSGFGGMGSSLMGSAMGGNFGGAMFGAANYLGSGGAYQRSLPQIMSAAAGGAYGPGFAKGGLVHSYQKGGLASLIDKVKELDQAFSGGLRDFYGELEDQGNTIKESVGEDLRGIKNRADWVGLMAPHVLDSLTDTGGDFLKALEETHNRVRNPRELDPNIDTRADLLAERLKPIPNAIEGGLGNALSRGVMADTFMQGLASGQGSLDSFFNTPIAEVEAQKQAEREEKLNSLALMEGLASVGQSVGTPPEQLDEELIDFFTNIPTRTNTPVESPQNVQQTRPEVSRRMSNDLGGYASLLNQIRGGVPYRQHKKSVFEDPLFNWGLALVSGRDPVSAYSGMAGESREESMQPLKKEEAIREMARRQLQTDINARQVDAQVSNMPTQEERDADLALTRARVKESISKSLGGSNNGLEKGITDWFSRIDSATINNPKLFAKELEAGAKRLSAAYQVPLEDVYTQLKTRIKQ